MARWIDLCYSCFIFSVYIVNIASNSTTAKYGNDEHVIVTECRTPNHDVGLCIRFRQCNVLFNQMNNTAAHDFLKASRCGSAKDDDSNPRVCCGKYDNFLPVVSRNRIFPTSCGRQDVTLGTRIVGGTEAGLGEFPWMVRLLYKNKNGESIFGCSGFLINYRHVVTAAHCTHPGNIRGKTIFGVVLGEHDTETNPDCSADRKTCNFRHIRRVTKVIIHPGYSPQNRAYYSDIAILQLRSGVKRSKYVQPICVLRNDSQIPATYYLSGWGKTEKGLVSTVLRKVELKPFDPAKCREKFAPMNINIKSDTQICAGGEEGKDSCVGDSGGPLMMVSDNETWYAAGVVSFGMMECGSKGLPGVYTNIEKFLPWIESQIEQSFQNLPIKEKKPKKPKVTIK